MTTDAFSLLFDALGDVEDAIHSAHPELPLTEYAHPDDPSALLADVVLLLIDNLRAATHNYQREAHLARFFPAASSD
jgi:hypothetical protein